MEEEDFQQVAENKINKYLDNVMENIAEAESILFEVSSNIKTVRALKEVIEK